MKINDFDLGFFNPPRRPQFAQLLGDVVVEGVGAVLAQRGGDVAVLPVKAWISAPSPIAGNAAGSQAANEALVRWLEEMARNPDLQHQLIQWSSKRALPQDGWWFMSDCLPDYTWTGGGAIPVDMVFKHRGPMSGPLNIYWGGAALKSAYSGAAINLVGLPQNSIGVQAGTPRTGAEGSYPFVLNPPGTAQSIVQFLGSSSFADLFKAGCHVYDAMAPIATNPVPTNGTFTNANWLEARGIDHQFVGDLVFTNGLILVTVAINGSVVVYAWTRAGAWQQVGTLQSVDNSGNVGVPLQARLYRVGYEEIACDVTFIGTAQSVVVTLRLQRAHRLLRCAVSPRSYANSTASLLRFVPAVGGGVIAFNETSSQDQTFGAGSLASTATYPYGACFLPSASWPFAVSFIYQGATGQVPTQQPGFGTSGAGINLGDTGGPAQYVTRLYALGITPLLAPATLQGNAFSGTLGTGWSSVADTGTRNGVSAAKCASGTLSGNADLFGTAAAIDPGTYGFYIRARVTSAAGSASEMTVGVWDVTAGAYVVSTTLRANSQATSYGVTAISFGFTIPNNGHTYQFRCATAATLGTDWFFDEAWITPVTLSTYSDGPQDLAQQFLFERATRYPVV